jgi:chromosome segregation ATPase
MGEISKNISENTQEITHVHDPVVKIKLSELARIHADAKYYADLVSQYVRIRNTLAREVNKLNKLIDHRSDEAAKLREELCDAKETVRVLSAKNADLLLMKDVLKTSVEELIEQNEKPKGE